MPFRFPFPFSIFYLLFRSFIFYFPFLIFHFFFFFFSSLLIPSSFLIHSLPTPVAPQPQQLSSSPRLPFTATIQLRTDPVEPWCGPSLQCQRATESRVAPSRGSAVGPHGDGPHAGEPLALRIERPRQRSSCVWPATHMPFSLMVFGSSSASSCSCLMEPLPATKVAVELLPFLHFTLNSSGGSGKGGQPRSGRSRWPPRSKTRLHRLPATSAKSSLSWAPPQGQVEEIAGRSCRRANFCISPRNKLL